MKRHAFDPVSLVFGLLFAFLAVFVLSGNNLADLYPLWVWTLPVMAVGLVVVLYGVRRLLTPAPAGSAPSTIAGPEPDERGASEMPADEDLGEAPPDGMRS